MKLTGFVILSSFCYTAVKATGNIDFRNLYMYETYYLEDYCGPTEKTVCTSEAHTVHLQATGSGSAAVIRGFRGATLSVNDSLKCCLTLKTNALSRFNVQLDGIHRKRTRLGEKCELFLRLLGLEEEVDRGCGKIDKYSFKSPKNVLEMEYALSPETVPDFQNAEIVVTSATEANRLRGAKCNASEWQCDDGNCIWSGFRCDGHNNCGDWSDEHFCGFFAKNWPVGLIIVGSVSLTLLTWWFCRCCSCCGRTKSSGYTYSQKPFQFVSSLAPGGHPLPQQKLYPSLEVPYQNSTMIPRPTGDPRGAPLVHNENAFLSPSFNPSYGATLKS